jgi:hypothetical protein
MVLPVRQLSNANMISEIGKDMEGSCHDII